jgi:tRNA pseudouridine38-40 synthase
MNLRLDIVYDGTDYLGWQIQSDPRTIQYELTTALSRLEEQSVTLHGAGRTDAGVHALGQVASVNLSRDREPNEILRAVNGTLPRDIRIISASEASPSFNARFDAKQKTYQYQIWTGEVMNPLLNRFAWHYPFALNDELVAREASMLVGTHDFTAFTVSDAEASSKTRTILDVKLTRNENLLAMEFTGEGFLRYQIRTMVAALLEGSRRRLGEVTMRELIERRDRSLAGRMAPAKGLTLMKVEY